MGRHRGRREVEARNITLICMYDSIGAVCNKTFMYSHEVLNMTAVATNENIIECLNTAYDHLLSCQEQDLDILNLIKFVEYLNYLRAICKERDRIITAIIKLENMMLRLGVPKLELVGQNRCVEHGIVYKHNQIKHNVFPFLLFIYAKHEMDRSLKDKHKKEERDEAFSATCQRLLVEKDLNIKEIIIKMYKANPLLFGKAFKYLDATATDCLNLGSLLRNKDKPVDLRLMLKAYSDIRLQIGKEPRVELVDFILKTANIVLLSLNQHLKRILSLANKNKLSPQYMQRFQAASKILEDIFFGQDKCMSGWLLQVAGRSSQKEQVEYLEKQQQVALELYKKINAKLKLKGKVSDVAELPKVKKTVSKFKPRSIVGKSKSQVVMLSCGIGNIANSKFAKTVSTKFGASSLNSIKIFVKELQKTNVSKVESSKCKVKGVVTECLKVVHKNAGILYNIMPMGPAGNIVCEAPAIKAAPSPYRFKFLNPPIAIIAKPIVSDLSLQTFVDASLGKFKMSINTNLGVVTLLRVLDYINGNKDAIKAKGLKPLIEEPSMLELREMAAGTHLQDDKLLQSILFEIRRINQGETIKLAQHF